MRCPPSGRPASARHGHQTAQPMACARPPVEHPAEPLPARGFALAPQSTALRLPARLQEEMPGAPDV
jgi:hypothetical protein